MAAEQMGNSNEGMKDFDHQSDLPLGVKQIGEHTFLMGNGDIVVEDANGNMHKKLPGNNSPSPSDIYRSAPNPQSNIPLFDVKIELTGKAPYDFGNIAGTANADLAQQVANILRQQSYQPRVPQERTDFNQDDYSSSQTYRNGAQSSQPRQSSHSDQQVTNEQALAQADQEREEGEVKREKAKKIRKRMVIAATLLTVALVEGGPVVQAATGQARARIICEPQSFFANIPNYGCLALEFGREIVDIPGNFLNFLPEQN